MYFSVIDEIATVSVESRHCSVCTDALRSLPSLALMRILKVAFCVMMANQVKTLAHTLSDSIRYGVQSRVRDCLSLACSKYHKSVETCSGCLPK